jgi:hypothetical protein
MLHYFWRGLVAFLLLYLTHYLHMHRMYTYMLQNKYTLTEKNGSNLKLWSLTPVPLTFEVRTVATAWLKLKKIWSTCSASQSFHLVMSPSYQTNSWPKTQFGNFEPERIACVSK